MHIVHFKANYIDYNKIHSLNFKSIFKIEEDKSEDQKLNSYFNVLIL